MKKSFILATVYFLIAFCIATFALLSNPFLTNIEASTLNQSNKFQTLQQATDEISNEFDTLETQLVTLEESLDNLEKRIDDIQFHTNKIEMLLVDYYMDKLKDPTYITHYNNDYIYYTAAENLGRLGKLAIPKLIARLDTKDDYERALVLYALLLASQDDSVKAILPNGYDYIHVDLDFNVDNHPQAVQIVLSWWETYKAYF